ncbi:MAG: methionine adenosyltransferase [Candidatus Zixiibacteriota bacterium]
MKKNFIFSSESVTEGHPDKVCDQISDAVLDAVLTEDPNGRVACETFATTGLVMVGGEISTTTYVDIPQIARQTIKEIGYTDPHAGFQWQNCAVITSIDQQSADIAQGVDDGAGLYSEQGAGDQGIMFGYACTETDVLMPLPITLAHRLAEKLSEVRKNGLLDYLRPDGKTQVAIEYQDGKPVHLTALVVAAQHTPDVEYETLKEDIIKHVVREVIPAELIDDKTKFYINATGKFVLGGPVADAGLTGRKIIVDTYGGVGSHGGGAFSGKDPTKVDRSASYMARYIAKNIVAAGLAEKALIELSYCIGVADPVSVFAETYGTGEIDDYDITQMIRKHFPLKPATMIEYLDLLRPIYQKTAAYGHFGRELPGFTWEKTDMVDILKKG